MSPATLRSFVLAAVASIATVASSDPGLAVTPPAGPQPLSIMTSGANGAGRIVEPGLACEDGGTGAYRHYDFEAPLAGGPLAALATTLRGAIAVQHTDGHTAAGNPAHLDPSRSSVTLENDRGVLRLKLLGGGNACGDPNLEFTGPDRVQGVGTIEVAAATGAYRGATATGTYSLDANLAPGADNSWTLGLTGAVDVPNPSLSVTVERTYWANLGLDYLNRIVTVAYRVTNSGPGDSYGTRFDSATPNAAGVVSLGPNSVALGDLLTGESRVVVVRYQLALVGGPCALLILGCQFPTTVTATMPDALDAPATFAAVRTVRAPDLPPPL